MNVFFLDTDPVLAAHYQCDKHVVKMILETAQMLSTAHRVLDGYRKVSEVTGKPLQQYSHPIWEDRLYKCAHINHPSTKWIRKSNGNYIWAYTHFMALCAEYTRRYGKIHQTQVKLEEILIHVPEEIPEASVDVNDFSAIAINEDIDKEWNILTASTVVEAYRRYYLYKTTVVSPFNYTNTSVPDFLINFGYDTGVVYTAEEAPWKLGLI